jgi:hypothetical protein
VFCSQFGVSWFVVLVFIRLLSLYPYGCCIGWGASVVFCDVCRSREDGLEAVIFHRPLLARFNGSGETK